MYCLIAAPVRSLSGYQALSGLLASRPLRASKTAVRARRPTPLPRGAAAPAQPCLMPAPPGEQALCSCGSHQEALAAKHPTRRSVLTKCHVQGAVLLSVLAPPACRNRGLGHRTKTTTLHAAQLKGMLRERAAWRHPPSRASSRRALAARARPHRVCPALRAARRRRGSSAMRCSRTVATESHARPAGAHHDSPCEEPIPLTLVKGGGFREDSGNESHASPAGACHDSPCEEPTR